MNAHKRQVSNEEFLAKSFTYHCSKQTINSPAEKRTIDKTIFAAPSNQQQKTGTIEDMVADLTSGHEVIPVEFIPDDADGIIHRSNKCWQNQQIIFLDLDHGIKQATLPEFVEAHPFIRDNAAFVLETLRSQFDDPDDDTCNGQLRLRSGFLLPEIITDADVRRRIGTALCDEISLAERGHAEKITAGGFGRVGGEVYWLKNTLSEEWFANTLKQIHAELEAEDAQRAQHQAEQKRRRQESNARSRRDGEYPLTALGKTDPNFYLSSLAEKPLTFQNKNAHGWAEWGRLGEVKATCNQTPDGYWYVTIFAETIDSPVHHEAIPFARFYCHREHSIDIDGLDDKSEASKSLNKQLAQAGFGVWIDNPSSQKSTTANGSPTSQPSANTPDGRFAINITDMPIHEIVDKVHSHWRTLDDDSIFVRGDSLCRILHHQGKTEAYNEDTFHVWLSRRFSFWKLDKRSKRSGDLEMLGLIPERIIRPLLRDVPSFVPRINAIYQHPIVLPGGEVAKDSGYIPAIKALLNSDWTGWDDLDTSDSGVKAAKSLLLDDLLHDFIWGDGASKANFLAYLLTFPMRPAIGGNVPMFAVTAPVQGAGKTLLLDLAHLIWQGLQALATQVGSDDRSEREEMRKRITALLMESPESVVFDNATRAFNNPALASVLTTGRYQDRILGASRNVELDVRTIFAATGNHLKFEGDMPRRVYWCRLGVDREKPEMRGDFKHPRLIEWATKNRDQLMEACLTLIKTWIENGMPLYEDVAWGSYEAWTQMMGGILHNCGVAGFSVSQDETDSEELVAMRDFCDEVYAEYNSESWTTADVFKIASHDDDDDDGILDPWLGSGKNQSRKTRLGLFLSERDGRYFGDFQLFKSGDKLRGATLFFIQLVAKEHQNGAARDDTDQNNASSNASSGETLTTTQVQGDAARDDTDQGGTRAKVSESTDENLTKMTNSPEELSKGIIPSSDGSDPHDNRAEGAARDAASVGSKGIIPSSSDTETPENCSENEQHPQSGELRAAPAHHATSGSVLDSLTTPQKFFLELLPIGDEPILSRYQTEGFHLVDEEDIKAIKRFLMEHELIVFDEELWAWQATEKYLTLRV